jgi:4-hydroxybenzoyl-CoA thioesterase
MERISQCDGAGPGWYWNNFSCGEHTGTHFDAPVHRVTGKDQPNNGVDTIDPTRFIGPACVVEPFPLAVARASLMSDFQVRRLIRFSDCDPAGIVFYPQYFVIMNGVVEDWFDGPLGIGYRHFISERGLGLPTVRLESDFRAVSRFGEDVFLSLRVQRMGEHSLTLQHTCRSAVDGELRMRSKQVIVTTSLQTHRPVQIPLDLREAICRHIPQSLEKNT